MKATPKRQETKCITSNDTYCDYSINVKFLHEDQTGNLNVRLHELLDHRIQQTLCHTIHH